MNGRVGAVHYRELKSLKQRVSGDQEGMGSYGGMEKGAEGAIAGRSRSGIDWGR